MEWGIWTWVNEILSPHYPTTIWCFSGPACAPAVPPWSLRWKCKGVGIGGGELVWCSSLYSFIPKTAQGHLMDTEATWGPNPGPWEGGGDDSSPNIQETPALCHKTCHTATPCGRWRLYSGSPGSLHLHWQTLVYWVTSNETWLRKTAEKVRNVPGAFSCHKGF